MSKEEKIEMLKSIDTIDEREREALTWAISELEKQPRLLSVEEIAKAVLTYHKAKMNDLNKWERATIMGEAKAVHEAIYGEAQTKGGGDE